MLTRSERGMCNGRVPTDGLVGFLSGSSTVTEWRDEYLGVNAIVRGPAEKGVGVPNGVTFQGSWAEWPVGKLGQTVPYYFANNKFTLVATVSIHEVPREDSSPIPLIGVRMNDTKGTVLFGLSYTHDRKWLAIAEKRAISKSVGAWEPHTTYRVVLQMDYDEWTVIVDQREIDRKSYNEDLFNSHRISHFYLGGDSNDRSATDGHVTVTNVMLYNDDLYNNELYKLNASKVTIPSLGVEEHPTGQVTSKEVSFASESKSEEIVTSCAELNEDDPDKQEEESVDDLVPAAPPSTVDAGSSVSEPAIAAESAGNDRPYDNAQFHQGETAQQATPNEENKSMQRGSDLQPRDSQPAELTEVTDVEMSSGSYAEEMPEEEGEADGRSGGSTSSVGASSDMDTATETVDSERQLQQSTELSARNE
ncbi:trans-sialidase, partial [Trypanosoma cruzi]